MFMLNLILMFSPPISPMKQNPNLACEVHLAFVDATELMDIMGYQAATAEMEVKVKRAW